MILRKTSNPDIFELCVDDDGDFTLVPLSYGRAMVPKAELRHALAELNRSEFGEAYFGVFNSYLYNEVA